MATILEYQSYQLAGKERQSVKSGIRFRIVMIGQLEVRCSHPICFFVLFYILFMCSLFRT